ncbi:MAG: alkaline phosphatase PhoX [Sporichthyaceae bacterium]
MTEREQLDPDRRLVLRAAVAGGLGLAFAGSLRPIFGGLNATAAPVAAAAPLPAASPAVAAPVPARPVGYGRLVADPKRRLSLPAGFEYRIVAEGGSTRLDTGDLTPGYADGSASFPALGGRTVLIVNHEQTPEKTTHWPVPAVRGLTFDDAMTGGTTTIVLDPDGNREREYVSLAGTDGNCSGGVTPWGTWLSCEETEGRAGERGRTLDHGYVFEVDPLQPEANRDPHPIKAFGRFAHEAAVVDPDRGHVYLTEDAKAPDGLLYRWSPAFFGRRPRRGALRKLGPTEGTLYAARAHDALGVPVLDLSVATVPGTTYRLQWVPVPDRDASEVSTRKQFGYVHQPKKGNAEVGYGPPITRGHKLEGAWWGNGGAFVVSSFAKPEEDGSQVAHAGQVWFLDPVRDTLTLVLRFEPTKGKPTDERNAPDNITVSPYGGVIIAQDGEGAQHLFGAGPDGNTFAIARNEARYDGDWSEFTGPHFSPDRRTLFANVQEPGTTFAISGPWRIAPDDSGFEHIRPTPVGMPAYRGKRGDPDRPGRLARTRTNVVARRERRLPRRTARVRGRSGDPVAGLRP